MHISVSSLGVLTFGGKEFRCALGRGGVVQDKKEGDGATPLGCFPLREVLYRADRLSKPETRLPTYTIQKEDGWCDDAGDSSYNKKVRLPYSASHEELWREDFLYDIVVPLGYNDSPPIPGKGSAIFMHVARPNYTPTAGCIALALSDLQEILRNASTETEVCIGA